MPDRPTLESVINVSVGRNATFLAQLRASCGRSLLDVHTDFDHNRSVFTLAGRHVEEDARRLANKACELIDITEHAGVHPRFGAVDVVPFVPLVETGATMDDAIQAQHSFAEWMSAELMVPCFLYGATQSLPEIRKNAFEALAPDFGPTKPNARLGACAVGARGYLIAYNLWLADASLEEAQKIARELRSPTLRTLALPVGETVQISCNLIAPLADEGTGPARAYDLVAQRARVEKAELVGLIPHEVLRPIPQDRWTQLDIGPDKTIEYRLSELSK